MWRYGLYRDAIERDSWWALVNVALWTESSGYGEGQMVGTGKYSNMDIFERLCRGTVGGHW